MHTMNAMSTSTNTMQMSAVLTVAYCDSPDSAPLDASITVEHKGPAKPDRQTQ